MIFSMNQQNFIIFAIILFISESISSQFIRPVTSNLKANRQETMSLKESISVFDMIDSRSIIKIDLNRPLRQQSIVLRNSDTVILSLFCRINIPPAIKKSDVESQFCFQSSLSQDASCQDLRKLKDEMSLFNLKISAKSIFNDSGYNIVVDSSKIVDIDLSGYYFCKFSSNLFGMVLSNVMEIRDILFWKKNLIISPPQSVRQKFDQNLEVSEMPKSFTCINQVNTYITKNIPIWIELEFKSIAKWVWCPVSKQRPNLMELEKTYIDDCLSQSISRCDRLPQLCPYKAGKMPGWIEFTSFDGTITLIQGQKFNDYGDTIDGYALMCYYNSKDKYRPLRYIANEYGTTQFLKGLQWLNKENIRKSFKIKEAEKQTVKVGILKIGFILKALYYAPANFTYEWRRNQNIVYNSSQWIVRPFSLEYKMKVFLKDEGEYILRVKSGDENFEFIFNVVVQSPPLLVNISLPIISSSIYKMVGTNLSIIYQYKGHPTNMQVYINGLPYTLNELNHKVFMNDLTKKSFYLKDLNFNIKKRSIANNIVEVTYNVTKLSYSDMMRLAEDHSIIMESRNEYGISRSHINVYVLMTPVYVNLPGHDNCTVVCSSRQPHLFRCEINDQYYLDREVIVEKIWTVNGIRLVSLPYYSEYFSEDSKGLQMSSVDSNKTEYNIALKLLFKKARLLCRIRLLYPGSLGMSDNQLIRERRIIFDSQNDPDFVSNSVALVSLDWEPNIASASYTWIVFLVIALILIMMFVFLLVRLTLRDQGKSYPLEKLEVANGLDRNIENEKVAPYVRSNNKSNGPTNNDSYGNGNKTESNKSFLSGYKPQDALDIIDDEDELEDANKFNEEGSFIGVYANKDKVAVLATEAKS